MNTVPFLDKPTAWSASQQFGTPTYVYDQLSLEKNVAQTLNFPNPFGLTVRYAMKAASNAAILHLFDSLGIHIDASSGFEAKRAMKAGISPKKISLSTQELPTDFNALYTEGMGFNACSLEQIRQFGECFRGHPLGLRFNPGMGSGDNKKTNVGGHSSSFGIWHEYVDEVKELVKQYDLKVFRIHTHIGSGSDPAIWQKVALMSLELVNSFPKVTILNLGGGYKVNRMDNEATTDLQTIGQPVSKAIEDFAQKTGRKIHLEIEPGTFLVANACTIIARIQDKGNTGSDGFHFLKLDTGMTEILRPSLYNSQHPLTIFSKQDSQEKMQYVVVGHCCESGDLLTPESEITETLFPVTLVKAEIGDLCLIGGAGAYCSSMSAKNYNSYPEAAEVLLDSNNELHLIRKRQTLDQVIENEVSFSQKGKK